MSEIIVLPKAPDLEYKKVNEIIVEDDGITEIEITGLSHTDLLLDCRLSHAVWSNADLTVIINNDTDLSKYEYSRYFDWGKSFGTFSNDNRLSGNVLYGRYRLIQMRPYPYGTTRYDGFQITTVDGVLGRGETAYYTTADFVNSLKFSYTHGYPFLKGSYIKLYEGITR